MVMHSPSWAQILGVGPEVRHTRDGPAEPRAVVRPGHQLRRDSALQAVHTAYLVAQLDPYAPEIDVPPGPLPPIVAPAATTAAPSAVRRPRPRGDVYDQPRLGEFEALDLRLL